MIHDGEVLMPVTKNKMDYFSIPAHSLINLFIHTFSILLILFRVTGKEPIQEDLKHKIHPGQSTAGQTSMHSLKHSLTHYRKFENAKQPNLHVFEFIYKQYIIIFIH